MKNKVALLLPSYDRINDLKNTLTNTFLPSDYKFIIVANYSSENLDFLEKNYSDKAIIIDERKYGKLGVCKAYNLAFETSKKYHFQYSVLFADDVLPFNRNWYKKLNSYLAKKIDFGIFSTDECHPGNFGWNIIKDAPIAHFFIIKNTALEILFNPEFKQYAIDLEISINLLKKGIEITLLPLKLNHLRSGIHREFYENVNNADQKLLNLLHPEYGEFNNMNFARYIPHKNRIIKISYGNGVHETLIKWNEKKSDKKKTYQFIKKIINLLKIKKHN